MILGRSKMLIAVRNRLVFDTIGKVEEELRNGDLVFFRPSMDDPKIPYKGMSQPSLFCRRYIRSNLLQVWEGAWAQAQRRPRPRPPDWDVDHVLPFCWARDKGFDYVLLTPIPKSINRSYGAGLEKSAVQAGNEELLAKYVDVDIKGNVAFLSVAAIGKLMNIAPGSGAKRYPGLERIKPDLKALEALFSY